MSQLRWGTSTAHGHALVRSACAVRACAMVGTEVTRPEFHPLTASIIAFAYEKQASSLPHSGGDPLPSLPSVPSRPPAPLLSTATSDPSSQTRKRGNERSSADVEAAEFSPHLKATTKQSTHTYQLLLFFFCDSSGGMVVKHPYLWLRAGEALACFFCASLRLHSLSRRCISSCETESSFLTTVSTFSDLEPAMSSVLLFREIFDFLQRHGVE
jgi:hypothetical protein